MGEEEPHIKIAIVTTVFNDWSCLPRLLSSLLAQTNSSFVHYLFDDGSTESPGSLLEDYLAEVQKRATPFEVVLLKADRNLGVNKAHEYVFRQMECTHFVWVDADDWVSENFVAYMVKTIRKHRDAYSVYHLNSFTYNLSYKRSKHSTAFAYNTRELKQRDQFPNFCMMTDEWFAHHFVVKFADFKKVNPSIVIFDSKNGDGRWYDGQIFFQMSACHLPFHFVTKPISHILARPTSVSRFASAHSERSMHYMSPLNEVMFRELNIPDESHILYRNLLPYRNLSLDILANLQSKKRKKALRQIHEYKLFLRQNNLSKSYLLFHTAIRHALIKSYLGPIGLFVRRLRKAIIGGHKT